MGEVLKTKFSFGDKVHIDGDAGIEAVVIGFIWRSGQHEAEVSWIDEGAYRAIWIFEWRLSLVKE